MYANRVLMRSLRTVIGAALLCCACCAHSQDNVQLQQQIMQAIGGRAPQVQVTVGDSDITVKGTVADRREKTEVARLVHSYCGNRHFHDELQVKDSRRNISPPTGSNLGLPALAGPPAALIRMCGESRAAA